VDRQGAESVGSATISIAVGGFTGTVRASLLTDELHRFNEGLKCINHLSGTAVLESMEYWINLTVKAASRGRIEISGELSDGPGGAGNALSFDFAEVDQTYLAGWISELDAIEKAFPVIGRP
jgi:hypothetical protein